MMSITVCALDIGERAAASRLLARAFAEDPILTHYLHDPVRRAVALPAFFEAVLEEVLPSTQVFAARSGDDLVGVAAWLPPNPVQPDSAACSRAERCRLVVRTMFPLTSGPLLEGFSALEALHPRHPHWYLAFIGIEPGQQGRGIGRDLLAPVLHAADETGTTCYLETPFPRTHSFYESLGFTRDVEHTVFTGSPQGVVTFIRAPGHS